MLHFYRCHVIRVSPSCTVALNACSWWRHGWLEIRVQYLVDVSGIEEDQLPLTCHIKFNRQKETGLW